MVAVVPAITSCGTVLAAGAAGLLLVGFAGGDPGGVVFKLRLAGAAVAATTAVLLDDPATETLASSPVPLVVRRGIRVALAAAFVALWWAVAAGVAGGAVGAEIAPALIREVAVLVALAVLGSVTAQRWSSDGRGGACGALAVLGWFALSFLPRVGAVPLPPQPLQPGAAVPLAAVALLAAGLTLLLSRDPAAARWRRGR